MKSLKSLGAIFLVGMITLLMIPVWVLMGLGIVAGKTSNAAVSFCHDILDATE